MRSEYSCTGTFTVHGRRYTESLPGTAFRKIGSTCLPQSCPNDPALVSPNKILKTEHTSASVFVLPLILLVVLLLLVALIVLLRRRLPRDGAAADARTGPLIHRPDRVRGLRRRAWLSGRLSFSVGGV